MVWALLDAGEPRLAAAFPFYGPAPDQPDFAGNTAAVLAVYAELDARVNASRDTAEQALEAAGLTHEMKTYPGVDHAFFNDTGHATTPSRPRRPTPTSSSGRLLPGLAKPVCRVWFRGGGTKVGEDREHPTVVAVALGQPQLAHDAADVRLDGPLGQPKPLGDRRVRPSFGNVAEHLALSGRETGHRSSWSFGARSRATTSVSSAEPPSATRRRASRKSSTSNARSFSR